MAGTLSAGEEPRLDGGRSVRRPVVVSEHLERPPAGAEHYRAFEHCLICPGITGLRQGALPGHNHLAPLQGGESEGYLLCGVVRGARGVIIAEKHLALTPPSEYAPRAHFEKAGLLTPGDEANSCGGATAGWGRGTPPPARGACNTPLVARVSGRGAAIEVERADVARWEEARALLPASIGHS